ncbi:MAG: hypothetical protein V1808_04290 [Candidatus Daviesbacteria bacterium]
MVAPFGVGALVIFDPDLVGLGVTFALIPDGEATADGLAITVGLGDGICETIGVCTGWLDA